MKRISIVTTMFNSEESLPRYFFSVLGQSYSNIEVVCVDDNSQDDTLKKLEYYSRIDKRIKVVHNETNLGPGESRNIGLTYCNGDFVQFVDSDDLLPSERTLETVVKAINEYNHLDALCGLVQFREKFSTSISEVLASEVWNTKLFTETLVYGNQVQGVWYFQRYLFNLKFLLDKKIVFPRTKTYEDVNFLTAALSQADNVLCLNHPTYVYTKSDNYMNREVGDEQKFSCYLHEVLSVLQFLEKNGWTDAIEFIVRRLHSMEKHYQEFVQNNKGIQETLNMVNGFLKRGT